MKELTLFYAKQCAKLRELHGKYVASNGKMNALYEAINHQVKSVGDIDMSSVLELLKSEQAKERVRNKELTSSAYHLKDFVRSIEIEAREYGLDWHESVDIFGY